MSNKEQNITFYKTQSNTSKLRDIRAFIKKNASETNLDQKSTENLILAVDEACTNLIKHAYNNNHDNEINLSFEIYDSFITKNYNNTNTNKNIKKSSMPFIFSYYQTININKYNELKEDNDELINEFNSIINFFVKKRACLYINILS